MVATPARIGFVTRAYRTAVSETPAVANKHGNLARESADPLDTYFTALADAQTRANERQALLSPERRVRTVTLTDVTDDVLALLDSEDMPTAHFIDEERGVDMLVIVTEVIIDGDAQTAQLTIWG